MVGQGRRPGITPLRLRKRPPISARPSRWRTKQHKPFSSTRRRAATRPAAATLIWQCASIAARGYGAQETTAASARARELVVQAGGRGRPLFQLTMGYGSALLRAASWRRCGKSSRPCCAIARTNQHRRKPASPAAFAGTTNWYAGDFEEALVHLDQALAIFDPQRDRDLAYRFPAMMSALVKWASSGDGAVVTGRD